MPDTDLLPIPGYGPLLVWGPSEVEARKETTGASEIPLITLGPSGRTGPAGAIAAFTHGGIRREPVIHPGDRALSYLTYRAPLNAIGY